VSLRTRPAQPADASAIARIYNEGIEDRVATFETRPRTEDDVRPWFAEGFPLVVVEEEGALIAWASAPPYSRGRDVYREVADFSVYVARAGRRRGAGRAAMEALLAEVEARGFWKLVGRIFPENEASLSLCRRLGFREVGFHRRHGKLDGAWRDVVVVERLLGEAAEEHQPS
jgi:L-amino acid N-acyltransferase YncA